MTTGDRHHTTTAARLAGRLTAFAALAALAAPGAAQAQTLEPAQTSSGTLRLSIAQSIDETPLGCVIARLGEGSSREEAISQCGADRSGDGVVAPAPRDFGSLGDDFGADVGGDRQQDLRDCAGEAGDGAPQTGDEGPKDGAGTVADGAGSKVTLQDYEKVKAERERQQRAVENSSGVGAAVLEIFEYLFGGTETNPNEAAGGTTGGTTSSTPSDDGSGGEDPRPECLDTDGQDDAPKTDCDAPAPDEFTWLLLGEAECLREQFTAQDVQAALDAYALDCMSTKKPGIDGTTVCGGATEPMDPIREDRTCAQMGDTGEGPGGRDCPGVDPGVLGVAFEALGIEARLAG